MATHVLAPENSLSIERKNASKFRKKIHKNCRNSIKKLCRREAQPRCVWRGIVDRRTTSRRLVQRTSALHCTFNVPPPRHSYTLGRVESIQGPERPVLFSHPMSTLAQVSRITNFPRGPRRAWDGPGPQASYSNPRRPGSRNPLAKRAALVAPVTSQSTPGRVSRYPLCVGPIIWARWNTVVGICQCFEGKKETRANVFGVTFFLFSFLSFLSFLFFVVLI